MKNNCIYNEHLSKLMHFLALFILPWACCYAFWVCFLMRSCPSHSFTSGVCCLFVFWRCIRASIWDHGLRFRISSAEENPAGPGSVLNGARDAAELCVPRYCNTGSAERKTQTCWFYRIISVWKSLYECLSLHCASDLWAFPLRVFTLL